MYELILEQKPFQIDRPPSKEDIERRKQICEDVSNSYTFRQIGKLPYERYANPVSRLIKNFKYPTAKITINHLPSEPLETTFRCLARDSRENVNFYISNEYNLDTDPSDTSHPLVGRFVYHSFSKDWPSLYALAELPANTFQTNLDYNVETVYLERKESKSAGETTY